jgi:predicted nucleic acid-binding protein
VIVVDATVLADFLAGETALQASAEELMREDSDWISIGLWRYELGNVLWKKVKFEKDDPENMRKQLESAARLLIETVEDVDLRATYDIAVQTGLTFYDASYVWLARTRGLTLRTRDKQILRECPDVALPMPMM